MQRIFLLLFHFHYSNKAEGNLLSEGISFSAHLRYAVIGGGGGNREGGCGGG